jgi:hypothetical protein
VQRYAQIRDFVDGVGGIAPFVVRLASEMPLRALILLGLFAASCVAPATVAQSPTASPTVAAATAASTAAATFSVPATFAAVCGTMSDGVQITRASATFLLNSPGRPPLKIASSGPAPIDMMVPSGSAQSGYVCLLLDAGKPLPIVAGLIGPQMPGFVAEGTFPATAARPGSYRLRASAGVRLCGAARRGHGPDRLEHRLRGG